MGHSPRGIGVAGKEGRRRRIGGYVEDEPTPLAALRAAERAADF